MVKETKRIRDLTGKFRTLVSWNGGNTWVLPQFAAQEKARVKAILNGGSNLHGVHWREKEIAKFHARSVPKELQAPVSLLPVPRHGKAVGGRQVGKKPKHRRNLRMRPPTEVFERLTTLTGSEGKGFRPTGTRKKKLPHEDQDFKRKKSHVHRCTVCEAKLVCACEKPYLKKNWRCGGRYCSEALKQENKFRNLSGGRKD